MYLLLRSTLILVLAFSACSPPVGGPNPQPDPYESGGGSPPPPCHPGCFPRGTLVETPQGVRSIESIRAGELVTLVSEEGIAVQGRVASTYCTKNRLLDVRTSAGTVRTTPTQPLCLTAGGFRRAGELSFGDRIWCWTQQGRAAAQVEAVVDADAEAPVFNLVVGESAVFVAGGFLARGKPPREAGAESSPDRGGWGREKGSRKPLHKR